ncbi:DNA-binding transcriptional regulator, MarR family [Halobacillus karajensis]|uniref:HTH-type transcriptional regulator SarZ n=1 Tax=Halobacillus karajensis TaxID=195088 RepID=A0A024P8J3_9BACI|nr:MarR family transcriptional regulator [Halobacillus karajensis]CDQ21520.1 Transcriptional regulator SlyA [Halobacillus karajensis]CDQ25454.1 Transcriptional regulator SlyA [Halobacillus karajensis]CDQ29015.1 Transcriptional regulator SlyA [Halobacillus karajensis]SEI09314.1 DNA-binding transcriptional regulator, MarR family [Halobacillus karajensis]
MEYNIDRTLGYNINMVSHFLQNIYNQRLGEYGLTHSQAKVIYFLAKAGEQSQSELQKQLHIKASSMNGLIETLRKHDRIVKRSCQQDKRTKLVKLTDKGMELHATILKIVTDIETEASQGLSAEEQQVMVSWLKKMQQNLKPKTARREN